MFGIGLPEMLLIMALALIVVGPDKLPDLARSLAKGLMELKKTAENLKDSFAEEDNPLKDIRPELEEAAKSLKNNLLDTPPYQRDTPDILENVIPPADRAAEAYQELLKHTSGTQPEPQIVTPETQVNHEPAVPPNSSETVVQAIEPDFKKQ